MIRIAFFWTADFSASILEWMIDSTDIEVELIVSQPDKPIGRKKILEPTAVKVVGNENNIEVLQPEKLRKNEEFLSYLERSEVPVVELR